MNIQLIKESLQEIPYTNMSKADLLAFILVNKMKALGNDELKEVLKVVNDFFK
jgi:hypothetical protein